MRVVSILVVLAALGQPAGAASKARQCQQACAGLVAACAARNRDLGSFQRACAASVIKRCRKSGTTVCEAFCGNGHRDGGESCDGVDLGGSTCASLGFASGALRCSAECRFDVTGCTPSATPTCGNGVRDGAEQCDGTDLGPATCASLGFASGRLACTAGCGYEVGGCTAPKLPASGQTTCWNSGGLVIACPGTGQDGDTRAGAPLAYLDNGDGTITDANTGLQWEKQSSDGSIHDVSATYTWANAFATHVAGLNAASFGGHSDWRLPNLKELLSIANYENFDPVASPAFNTACAPSCSVATCSCIASSPYWSSTTAASSPSGAWYVEFKGGLLDTPAKTNTYSVRGVRGGS